MVAMATLRQRADELRQLPKITPLRLYWILRREFPWAERFQLVQAAQLEGYHRGITPGWGRLHPVVIRWQKKGRPEVPVTVRERKVVAMDYPVMTIQARRLEKGDWIEGEGHAERVGNYTTMILVWFADRKKFFQPLELVKVRLEDHGQTE
jgi:hypothetical protein